MGLEGPMAAGRSMDMKGHVIMALTFGNNFPKARLLKRRPGFWRMYRSAITLIGNVFWLEIT